MVIPVPDPYDFQLSTVRFRDFGSDGATVWHDDGLHRVVAGREVRIEAAPGGVRVEPGERRRPWRRSPGCSGSRSLSIPSASGPSLDPVLGRSRKRFAASGRR